MQNQGTTLMKLAPALAAADRSAAWFTLLTAWSVGVLQLCTLLSWAAKQIGPDLLRYGISPRRMTRLPGAGRSLSVVTRPAENVYWLIESGPPEIGR